MTTQNSPPVANAGPAQTVFVGQTVTLDGSKSSDADGDPLTYAWSLLSKPASSAASLVDPTSVNPTFVPDAAGTYVAQLIVNDGKVNSAPATVTITAQPLPDTAAPSLSVTSPADGATVNRSALTVTGTASDAGKGDSGISGVTVNGSPASGGTAVGADVATWSANLTLVPGPNLIMVVAKDSSPARNQTTVSLTVKYVLPDTTPPVIGPVSDLTAEATSAAGAVVIFPLPTVTDDTDPAPTVSASPPRGAPSRWARPR